LIFLHKELKVLLLIICRMGEMHAGKELNTPFSAPPDSLGQLVDGCGREQIADSNGWCGTV